MRVNRVSAMILMSVICVVTAQQTPSQHTFEKQGINLNLTKQQWQEDLRHFANELTTRHKNAFHTISREQFNTELRNLAESIPKLSNEEIYVGFLKLIAMVNDGHTSLDESGLLGFGMYPIKYEAFEDGLYVMTSVPKYREIVGGKVVKIGGKPIEDVLPMVRDITSRDPDNEMSVRVQTPFFLTLPRVLKGLGIAKNDQKISLEVEIAGLSKTMEIESTNDLGSFFGNKDLVDANQNAKDPKPLYLKNPQDNYWFEYVEKHKIAYVQINRILNKKEGSLETFVSHVIGAAETAPVEKLVLDLRFNTGGNNLLDKPIVVSLIRSRLNKRGKLFVIIGRRTLSAAQNLVNEIEKYTDAVFVGEPTGNNPNQFGDPVKFALPHSNLTFRASSLWHQIDPRDTRSSTPPDISAEPVFRDYQENIDRAWEAIISYKPGQAFEDLTSAALSDKDISVFISRYEAFKDNSKNKYVNTEVETNALGYRLIQAKRFKEAVEVFKLNVRDYPKSANVYDSLGEAYLLSGDRAKAIEFYERALKINPNLQSAIDAITRLKHANK